jgi:hypothetical protein
MSHCTGGRSGDPTSLFDQLRAWVENGTAPESSPVEITDLAGAVQERILCPYPRKATFDEDCGKTAGAQCWACA